MSIRFSEEDVRSMGRPAGGVRGITLEKDDAVVAAGGRGAKTPRCWSPAKTASANARPLISSSTMERSNPFIAFNPAAAKASSP